MAWCTSLAVNRVKYTVNAFLGPLAESCDEQDRCFEQ